MAVVSVLETKMISELRCRIADLSTVVPAVGDLGPRCRDYISHGEIGVDIIIHTDRIREKSFAEMSDDLWIYIKTGGIFFCELLKHDGIMLHASAVELDGKAYLFSAPCGTGKSTHTRLWQSVFGEKARVFNDDKPALRLIDGVWYAYGTPWCGKDGININMKVPIAGICFLKQAPENKIRRLSSQEAAQNIIWQTLRKFKLTENLDLMLSHVDKLARQIPVFELENRPEPEAVQLSYTTMLHAAEEMGL